MVEGLSFVLSPEGAKVATISGSEVGVRIWDIATGLRTHSIALGDTPDDAPLTFSPDCRYVAYVGNYGMIRILDLETGTQVKSLKGFWNYARSIRWERAGLLTHRGIYGTQALLNDIRDSIEYGRDNIPAGALSGIGISSYRDWVLKNGECYLWIPPENRGNSPLRPYYGDSGNAIAFGETTDQIYFIRFPSAD